MTDDTPPEPSWKFRRIYTYALTVLNCGGVGAIIWRIDDAKALMWIALALIVLNIVLATLYIAGAAFEWSQILKINIGKGAEK